MPTPSAPLRLLFVEDDAAIVQGLQYALTQEGYAVTHAGSLAAARAALPAGLTCCCSMSACPTVRALTCCARQDGATPNSRPSF